MVLKAFVIYQTQSKFCLSDLKDISNPWSIKSLIFFIELLTKFTKYVIWPYCVTGTGIREGTKVETFFFSSLGEHWLKGRKTVR